MSVAANRYQEELKRIKKNVEQSYLYNKHNVDRWNKFRYAAFVSSISDEDRKVLSLLKMPELEFNGLEAYISRLRGEFSKQEPSIVVRPGFGTQTDPQTVSIVEGHLRHLIADADKDSFSYDVYTDMLSGGFSVIKIYTDYADERSFDQVIKIERTFDPTMCGFDPVASKPHKGDGKYCCECYPITKDDFEQQYPGVDTSRMKFSKMGDFSWSYSNEMGSEKVILLCDYYEKTKKRTKIVRLSNGASMTSKEYQEFVDKWELSQRIEQVPQIVDARMSDIQVIVRYRLVENTVIDYTETDYNQLPLVLARGNSLTLRKNENGSIQEFHRPYIYHAMGVQKLKNMAGQSLANELENMIKHKFIAPIEGIPDGEEEAYRDVQQASVLFYRSYLDNDPNIPLQRPEPVVRPPMPPEIAQAFGMSDQAMQNILGDFAADLSRIGDAGLSGIAIQESATLSNAAAMPYICGYLQAMTQVASIIVDLIPKYYVTPRTIPTQGIDGKKSYVTINSQGAPSISYQSNSLKVEVEAGVNFSIQKSRALQQIIALMQASPMFAQFMNSAGLEVLLDNIEIRGADQLKAMVSQFMQQQQAHQQQSQQMQQQMNPVVVNAKLQQLEIQRKSAKDQSDARLKAAELGLKQRTIDNDTHRVAIDAATASAEISTTTDRIDAEKERAAVDLAIKAADTTHSHQVDIAQQQFALAQHHLDKSKHIYSVARDAINDARDYAKQSMSSQGISQDLEQDDAQDAEQDGASDSEQT